MAHGIDGCTCPDDPRTAADFDQMIACPMTSPWEEGLLRRTAVRLAAAAARRDPRSMTFDPRFAVDFALVEDHRRAWGTGHRCEACAPGEVH